MEEENKNAYSEVIEILKLIDDEQRLEAMPMEMLELLKSKANPEYKPSISMEIPLEEQNLQPETYSILSWIASKYWNNEIERIEEEEEKIGDINMEEEITENSVENTIENNTEISNLPIEYKELKWYQKIKVKIIEFFNKILRKKADKNIIEER